MSPAEGAASAPTTADATPLPLDVLATAVALGSAVGLTHVAVVYVRRHLLGTFTFQSRDVLWMAPLGYTLVLLVPGLVVAAALFLPRRRPGWRALGVTLGFVAALGAGLLASAIHWWAITLLALGVALRFGAMLRARPVRWRSRLRAAAVVLSAAVVLVAGVEQLRRDRRPSAEAPNGAPNVLLIILDTVRAASMSLYGHERPTTPGLDAFARDAVVFDWAIAPAPWTLSSHASIFTGRPPGALSARWRHPLDDRAPVVAEAFRARGYATGGFVANPFYTHHESGLARGFDSYRDFEVSLSQILATTTFGATASGKMLWRETWPGALRSAVRKFDLTVAPEPPFDRRSAEDVAGEFLDWQKALGQRPFFAFLNLFDAHDPYDPPAPWAEKFPEVRPVVRHYEGGIAYMDHVLDSLFAELRRRGLLDRTIVVVTADHGEQFGEHGLSNHGNSLYLPLLHVPLVVRYPARLPPGRVSAAVSLRDLAATLLDLADVDGEKLVDGESLVPVATGDARSAREVVAETEQLAGARRKQPAERGDMAALLTDSLHFIRNEDGTFELYAYRTDRDELHDVAATPAGCTLAVAFDARIRSRAPMLSDAKPLDPGRCMGPPTPLAARP